MPYSTDLDRNQREEIRWRIMRTLDASRPLPCGESLLFRTLNDIDLPVGPRQLRRELKYLKDAEMLSVRDENAKQWSVELTAYGVDVVEYSVDSPPGISRPPRFWND